ncbi:MAG: hypothetical protein WAV13_00380 [Thermodesulfovibrionales bacterium]
MQNEQNNSGSMTIDTGEKRIEVLDRFGNHRGEIVFTPKDLLWAEKFYALVDTLPVAFESYKVRARELQISKASIDERIKLMIETCDYLRDEIDKLFGKGTSQMAFGDTRNLEVFPQFFDKITPFVKGVRQGKMKNYLADGVTTKGKKRIR